LRQAGLLKDNGLKGWQRLDYETTATRQESLTAKCVQREKFFSGRKECRQKKRLGQPAGLPQTLNLAMLVPEVGIEPTRGRPRGISGITLNNKFQTAA
jgi:hypothetical protein